MNVRAYVWKTLSGLTFSRHLCDVNEFFFCEILFYLKSRNISWWVITVGGIYRKVLNSYKILIHLENNNNNTNSLSFLFALRYVLFFSGYFMWRSIHSGIKTLFFFVDFIFGHILVVFARTQRKFFFENETRATAANKSFPYTIIII